MSKIVVFLPSGSKCNDCGDWNIPAGCLCNTEDFSSCVKCHKEFGCFDLEEAI